MHRSDYRPPQITEALKWLDGHIDAQQIWCITYQNALRVIKKRNYIIIGRKRKKVRMDNKTINMNDDEVEIDLLQLFRALKKRILWIVGAGVIMGGAFGLFSKFAITRSIPRLQWYIFLQRNYTDNL